MFSSSDEVTLRQMRFRASMQKRGMVSVAAAARISSEWEDYKRFIRPHMEIADLIVHVDKDFVYRLLCKADACGYDGCGLPLLPPSGRPYDRPGCDS